ncbi:hypothetical protein FJZ36_01895 [Candidatus Poribacteria bacterium]|nr:hypothetical protein [Candidatus Poribacteria bacterium]
MSTNSAADAQEREYSLTEAARALNKSEASLRMRIKRGTLNANIRYIDDSNERYQYMIPESELEKERNRQSSTVSDPAATVSASVVPPSHSATPATVSARASQSDDIIAELQRRQDRLEAALKQEREDARALIRALEQQLELIRMMLAQALNPPR